MATSHSARWHEEPKNEAHRALVGVFRVVRDECEWRVDADEYHAGLYCASDRPGVRGLSRRGYEYGPATLPDNVCRSAVDTLTSKIAKHRPLPQCLTQRASWSNQKRARKMTQFLEGEFYRQRFFEKWWPLVIRDSLIFGRGLIKVWVQGDKPMTERVHPWEVFVDEWDARYGDPRNLYHVRSMDRGVAVELLARTSGGNVSPKLKDAIVNAGRLDLESRSWTDSNQATVDRVDVLEAWHLPSAPGADDGRHVICVEGATLIDESWTVDYFPIIVLHYNDPLSGYFGTGLVEQIEGYQYEINLSNEKLSDQYRMSGVGIVVSDGNQIHDQEIRNGITILRKKNGGEPPSVFQMDLVNEHMRARPEELTRRALNNTGMSQMSVQSEKPAGITAAIALQTLDDIETERFMVFGRAVEAFCLEVGRRYIDCAKAIAKAFGDHAVSVPMKGGLIDLNWNDVVVDGVEIRVFPTSLLPQQLGARLEKLKDLWNTGLIDRATFLRHLDAPDMQAELDLETADRLVVDEMLEKMLEADEEEGEAAFIAPSTYQQLEAQNDNGEYGPGWVPRRAQQKYNRALLDGAPEFNLELLRRFLKQCDEEMAKLAAKRAQAGAPGAAAPMPGGGGPPAGPPPAATPMAPELPNLGVPGVPAAA